MRAYLLLPLYALLLLALAGPVLAVDGVLEINQTCAVNTGCFSGDAAGFPVEITEPGSYRLTSNLAPPDIETNGVSLFAANVTLDLGGFGIVFPGTGCVNQSICPQGEGDGVEEISPGAAGSRSTVRNGFVRNAGRYGVKLGHLSLIEAVRVDNSGQHGIVMSHRSILMRSQTYSSGASGASLGAFSPFSHNVFASSDRLQLGAPDRVGGTPVVGNMCSDYSCGPAARHRRYYLSTTVVFADHANIAGICQPGFHFGSFGELASPSSLEYDATLGMTSDDSGSGPPGVFGWARSGENNDLVTNCNGWSTINGAHTGLIMELNAALLQDPAEVGSPWNTALTTCFSISRPIWCVED
jgi:hypothetical protein